MFDIPEKAKQLIEELKSENTELHEQSQLNVCLSVEVKETEDVSLEEKVHQLQQEL